MRRVDKLTVNTLPSLASGHTSKSWCCWEIPDNLVSSADIWSRSVSTEDKSDSDAPIDRANGEGEEKRLKK